MFGKVSGQYVTDEVHLAYYNIFDWVGVDRMVCELRESWPAVQLHCWCAVLLKWQTKINAR